MKRKAFYTLCLLLCLSLWGVAQTRVITGRVVDQQQGSPLPGVTIKVIGTNVGTQSGLDGSFRLEVPENAQSLQFSFVGYNPQQVNITAGRNNITVSLSPNPKQLNEVVVVGYGQQNQKELTGALTQVSGKQVENVPVASIDQNLQGKVPGLQIVATNGQPGAAVNVRLRGIGSFNAGAGPLWVIDGVPVNAGDLSRGTPTTNALAGLNPNDIESITVLKDAASASIYGSRAANGVILITTKRGKAGKTNIRVDGQYGWNTIALSNTAKPLNTHEFYTLTKEGLINAGFASNDAQATNLFLLNWGDTTTNTNWLDVVTRTGKQQQYNISASGGNEKTTFYLSGGYFQQQAATIGSDLTRYSTDFNLNHRLSEKISFGINTNVSDVDQHGPYAGGAFRNPLLSAYFLLPNLPATDNSGRPDTSFTGSVTGLYNPLAIKEFDRNNFNAFKILSNFSGEYSILTNLRYNMRFGIEYDNLREMQYWSPFYGDGKNYQGLGTQNITNIFNWVWTNTLNYRYYFNSNTYFNILVGYESQLNQFKVTDVENRVFPYNLNLYVLAVANKPTTASNNASDFAIASAFTRAEFNYQNRYIISGSFRRDGSSRFGANNRYGNFYSVGVSWNADQEKFFQQGSISNWISTLKLRASYGENGNADIGNYVWRELYGFTSSLSYNQIGGSAPSTPGNPNLTWEKNKPLDIGINLGLWSNRLNIDFDWYNRKTTDLLFNVPASYTSGFGSYPDNIGSLQNRGIELTVDANPIRSAVNWDIGFNLSLNKNKILSLPNHKPFANGAFYEKEGYDIQTWYVRKYAGVDPQTGNAQWYYDPENYKDSLTTSYSKAQRILFGSASPKGFGSVFTTLSYKGFKLYAQVYYQWGNYVRDIWARYTQGDGFGAFFNKTKKELQRWQKPGDKTDVPKYIYNNPTSSNEFSTRFLYKGDYVRLKEIQLSYDFRPQLLQHCI
ncbi:MAG: SusC/RagA family TonB-linked outer membrane protein [Thermoflavifilum sp.]|nr:SusC/RagA family TonB-linked outer membrane protein [Thermoflavifilum sp.]